MVRCPKCGTQNPDDRRVCNKCGARLPEPEGLPDWLAGLTDDAAFSDTDEGTSEAGDDAWPDWLADEQEEEPSAAPSALDSDIAPSDDNLPDWLSGIMMDSDMPEAEETAPASEPEEDFAPSELP
ncbi:MAG: zinc ribbon domain-containing protein, partial [Anaerolineales bacterium]